jgi:hypothetical protein
VKDRDVPWHIVYIGVVWAFAFAVDFEMRAGDTPSGDVGNCDLDTLFVRINDLLRHKIAPQRSLENCLVLRKCGRS